MNPVYYGLFIVYGLLWTYRPYYGCYVLSQFSHVATSLMCHFPSGNFSKVRLGPLRPRRLYGGGASAAARMGYGGRALPMQDAGGGPSPAARTDFGSCRLGTCTFGKLQLGKILLGRCHLGKILWESSSQPYYVLCIQYTPRL